MLFRSASHDVSRGKQIMHGHSSVSHGWARFSGQSRERGGNLPPYDNIRVFSDIFNLSLSLSVLPTCFKRTTIVPVPKNTKVTCMNDYCPIAVTCVIMKCFERLVKSFICFRRLFNIDMSSPSLPLVPQWLEIAIGVNQALGIILFIIVLLYQG